MQHYATNKYQHKVIRTVTLFSSFFCHHSAKSVHTFFHCNNDPCILGPCRHQSLSSKRPLPIVMLEECRRDLQLVLWKSVPAFGATPKDGLGLDCFSPTVHRPSQHLTTYIVAVTLFRVLTAELSHWILLRAVSVIPETINSFPLESGISLCHEQ